MGEEGSEGARRKSPPATCNPPGVGSAHSGLNGTEVSEQRCDVMDVMKIRAMVAHDEREIQARCRMGAME